MEGRTGAGQDGVDQDCVRGRSRMTQEWVQGSGAGRMEREER